MKSIFKKILTAGLLLAITGSFAACGQAASASTKVEGGTVTSNAQADIKPDEQKANVVLKVGANITPHSEILEVAKPILASKGITLEIVKL